MQIIWLHMTHGQPGQYPCEASVPLPAYGSRGASKPL